MWIAVCRVEPHSQLKVFVFESQSAADAFLRSTVHQVLKYVFYDKQVHELDSTVREDYFVEW